MMLVLFLSLLPIEAQNNKPNPAASVIPTVGFCDLINRPDAYDGKRVKFRAKYLSTFEASAFVDSDCTDREHLTWVEFDRSAIEVSSSPKVLRKVQEQIYCCMYAGLSYSRHTEMLVTGVFHSSEGKYGHDSMYRFMVEVKKIEEIGETEQIKVPGFDPN
jgi:hypothetical protein